MARTRKTKEKEKKKLEQTRGAIKLKGLIKNLDRDNAYKESVQEKGEHAGDIFRSLNFGVQTTPTNQVRMSMFAYEPKEVFVWNSKKKEKNKDYKGERVPFDEYLDKKEVMRANGDVVLQARIGVEFDEEGKVVSHGMTSFEAIDEIYNNLDVDDSVFVEGNLSFSSYIKDDKVVQRVNYNVDRLHLAKEDFDFDDEKYEEQNYYEQEMVFVGTRVDNKKEKMYVTGRMIDYYGKTTDYDFVINYGEDEDLEHLAKMVKKELSFGDLIQVWGRLTNEANVEEESGDNNVSVFGGKKRPKYAQSFKGYNQEITIEGILNWVKGKYTVEDFVDDTVEEEDEEEISEVSSVFGGKKRPSVSKEKTGSNPFEEDEEEDDDPFADKDEDDPFADEDDDDMPF